jgi:hypothetical protein
MFANFRVACGFGAALLFCGLAAGCGSSGSSSGSTGSLSVRLADAPMEGVQEVNITFTKIEANGPAGWQTLWTTPADKPEGETVNLLTLVRTDRLLAANPVPAGHYNQVRFLITGASLVDDNGNKVGVTVPSGLQTGVKVNVNCDVLPGGSTALLCDFNVARSFHETPPGSGSYMLQPVIKTAVQLLSGTIIGTVTMDGTTPAVGATVKVYPANAAVQTDDTMVNSTVCWSEDGYFKVWALEAGTYDVVISYTNPDGTTLTTTLEDVSVENNQDTALNGGVAISLAPAPPAE